VMGAFETDGSVVGVPSVIVDKTDPDELIERVSKSVSHPSIASPLIVASPSDE